MAYTKAQARKLAEQIHSRFGSKIASVTAGTPIPPEFIAALIGVEAGKDRKGNIVESATRFEPHVFAKLKDVRDGRLRQYNNIRRLNLTGASDAALKALATSYGISQIMGWWTIHLGGTVAELRDPKKHLDYTVKLLLLNSKDGDFERKEYVGEFREWNSGSEKGRTYHADYVANADAVMTAYRELGPVESAPLAKELVEDLKADSAPENPKAEEPTKPEPSTDTAQQPESGVATVQKVAQSVGSQVMSGGTLGAGILSAVAGAFLGIVKNPYAFAILILGCAAIAAYLWNQSKNRQLELQKDLNAKAASTDLNTVRIKPPEVAAQ